MHKLLYANARPQDFQQPFVVNGGGGGIVADLTLPGEFAYSSRGMIPDDGSAQNRA
jgi:hypothetical protein